MQSAEELGPGSAWRWLGYARARVVPNPSFPLEPASRFSVEFDVTAGTERKAHFLAGRFCAAQALRDLGVPEWQQPIGRSADGAPAWPAGVVGSITHSRGFASAAVAQRDAAGGIGIDAEPVVGEERARSISGVVAWPIEVAAGRAAGLSRLEAVTLVFSAKETVFKCLHAHAGRIFDFHDVRVTDVEAGARTFAVRIVKSIAPAFPAGAMLAGRFDLDAGWIHTAMILAARAGS